MPKCVKCGINFNDDEGIFVRLVGRKEFFACWKDFDEHQATPWELCPKIDTTPDKED